MVYNNRGVFSSASPGDKLSFGVDGCPVKINYHTCTVQSDYLFLEPINVEDGISIVLKRQESPDRGAAIMTSALTANVFNSPSTGIEKSGIMLDSFVEGTSLIQLDPNIKPMSFSSSFPRQAFDGAGQTTPIGLDIRSGLGLIRTSASAEFRDVNATHLQAVYTAYFFISYPTAVGANNLCHIFALFQDFQKQDLSNIRVGDATPLKDLRDPVIELAQELDASAVADLELSFGDIEDSVHVGNSLIVLLSARNNGSINASDVVINLSIPTEFVVQDLATNCYQILENRIVCVFAYIAPQETREISFRFQVRPTTQKRMHRAFASVSTETCALIQAGGARDNNSANNVACQTTLVLPRCSDAFHECDVNASNCCEQLQCLRHASGCINGTSTYRCVRRE